MYSKYVLLHLLEINTKRKNQELVLESIWACDEGIDCAVPSGPLGAFHAGVKGHRKQNKNHRLMLQNHLQ